MALEYGTWHNSLFYISSTGTVAEQFPKLQEIALKTRKWEEASGFERTGSYLNSILQSWAFGDDNEYKKVRLFNDYTFAKLRIQKNTGTDTTPVWVDLVTVDTSTGATDINSTLNVDGEITNTTGGLTLGGNLDMNSFYIRNLGGINSIQFTQAGRTYTTTFTSQTSVVVNHNLNTSTPIVTVFQTSDSKAIVPENIEATSANQCIVTFGEAAVSGTILVAGGVGDVGLTFSDGTESISYSRELHVNPAHFYLTKSNDGNGYAVLNAQPISFSSIDHGGLSGLADDDHTIYTKADGTRAFSGVVVGVDPVISTHLATKGYIDTRFADFYRNVVGTGGGVSDHGALTGLSDDDHSQYLLATQATDRATFTTNWGDLTDAGATTLHKHDHGGMDGLSDDDHSQYLLAADATNRATFAANWTDLTDGGVTSLHSHAGGVGSTDPGFYGIVWSDGLVTQRTDRLSFSNADFYLDGSKPTVNLKGVVRDTGAQRIDGTLEMNIPAQEPDGGAKTVSGVSRNHRLFVHQDGDYGIGTDFHGNVNTTVPGTRGYRSRGTAGTPTIVIDDDILNGIYGYGFDGVDYEQAGRVRIVVDGTPASDSMPGKIQFQVTPPGSVTPATAVQIRSDKHVEMENTLRVKNAVTAEAFYLTSGGEVGTGSALTVRDEDGTPTATNVSTIRFTNGAVTDNGGGDVSIALGGGSGISTLTIGGQSFGSQTTLGLNPDHFYLSGGATTKVLNLRQEQDIYKGHLPGVIVDNFLLEPDSDHSFTVLDATVDCRTGTASLGFYIISETNLDFPGRPITGLHAVTASSTKATTAATAQNTMNVGDRLLMSIFGVSSAEHLVYKVRLKKN